MKGYVPSIAMLPPLSYKNGSGVAIPSYAMLELTGDSDVSATGTISLTAQKPSGSGVYFAIDSGKGATASGNGQFGQAVRPIDSIQWAYFLGDVSTLVAWKTVLGPKESQFDISTDGIGYVYTGVSDSSNHRIQVMQVVGDQQALVAPMCGQSWQQVIIDGSPVGVWKIVCNYMERRDKTKHESDLVCGTVQITVYDDLNGNTAPSNLGKFWAVASSRTGRWEAMGRALSNDGCNCSSSSSSSMSSSVQSSSVSSQSSGSQISSTSSQTSSGQSASSQTSSSQSTSSGLSSVSSVSSPSSPSSSVSAQSSSGVPSSGGSGTSSGASSGTSSGTSSGVSSGASSGTSSSSQASSQTSSASSASSGSGTSSGSSQTSSGSSGTSSQTSSGSNSGSGTSGSGTSTGSTGCTSVVTDVKCDGNGLTVTKSNFVLTSC